MQLHVVRLPFVLEYLNDLWVWFKAAERRESERRRKKVFCLRT